MKDSQIRLIIRNIFDQYTQPENRLTHALVSSIAQDQYLLREFLTWTTGHTIHPKETIYVIEQSLPDQIEESEDEATHKGLPDACIYNNQGWVLIIESKVALKVSINQLNRHISTLKNRGFWDIQLLIINTDNNETRLPQHSFIKTWSEIYVWGYKYIEKSMWAKQFTGYFEVAEMKMIKDEYLKEGTLTRFTGIHFNNDNPYSYPEAKRLLKLLMVELKTNKKIISEMGVDPQSTGRGAITGLKGYMVWDFLSVSEARGAQAFTQYPHVTIGIRNTNMGVSITIPHGVKKDIFNNVFKNDMSSFRATLLTIMRNLKHVIKIESGAKPFIRIVQRHYKSQRDTSPTIDAELEFDLRTAFNAGVNAHVKRQHEWLNAACSVMCNKKSNLQIQVGVEFVYDKCKTISGSKSINLFVESILALKPFLDLAMGRG